MRQRYIYRIDGEERYFTGFTEEDVPGWSSKLTDAKTYTSRDGADEEYETLREMGFAVMVG